MASGRQNGWRYDPTNSRLDYYYLGTRVGAIGASGLTTSGSEIINNVVQAAGLSTNLKTGVIVIPLQTFRLLSSGDIVNTATTAGGVLAKNTAPILERVNGATDTALRIKWAANDVVEITNSFSYPPDLDDTAPIIIALNIAKDTNTNTSTNFALTYFEGIGDSNAGASTAALATSALAVKTVTIAASDVGAAPNFASISLTPAAHANDAISLYGIEVRYTRKT